MDWLKTYSRYLFPVYCLLFAVYLFSSMAYAGGEMPSGNSALGEEEMTADEDEGMITEEDEEMETEEGDEDEEEGVTEEIEGEIEIPNVVATVNGVKIPGQDLKSQIVQRMAMDPEGFDAMGREETKKEIIRILDGLILQEVIYQGAVKRNIGITDEEIGMGIEDFKRKFPSEVAFEEALTDSGITIPSLQDVIRKDLMAVKSEEMAMDGLVISDKEIEEYYEKNKKDLNKDAIRVSHILVKTEEEARDVIKELEKGGEDFEAIAKRYSIDTFTEDKGGELGWYSQGDLMPEVEEATYSLSPGQISAPLKSRYGYHIMRMEEKKQASGQTLEDHREHVRSILQQKKWQQGLRDSWVRLLLNESEIWRWEPGSPTLLPPHQERGMIFIKDEKGEEIASGMEPAAIKIPDVVATVNGKNITNQYLEDRMERSRAMDPERFDAMGLEDKKKAMTRTIDNIIMREVIYQEAIRKGIDVTEEEIDLNLDSLKRQFPSEEAFEKAFADARMTIPAWKEETRKNLMAVKLEEMMVEKISIPDSEIADYYEKNKNDLNKDAIKLSHILVRTEEEAKEVIKEFKEKKDFGALVKKYSIDTLTKEKGGDVGWHARGGGLLKEMEDAAFPLSPGEISGTVKSQYGYHIIRMEEKMLASGQTLEDHREHVRSILQQEKWQKLRPSWQEGLLTGAEIWSWAP